MNNFKKIGIKLFIITIVLIAMIISVIILRLEYKAGKKVHTECYRRLDRVESYLGIKE